MKSILFSMLLTSAAIIVQPATASLAVETSSAVEASSRKPQHFVDRSNHSASTCVIGNQQTSELDPKRILSLAGGGIRGIYEAALLSIIEELLNLDNHGRWERVADKFDVIGGTSTGSLLAAGLSYKSPIEAIEPYKAIELLQLYVRYGFKIFDDQASSLQGVIGAKYMNEGLDQLLSIFFGEDTSFKDVSKPLYVVAHLKDDKQPLVHSTRNKATFTTPGSNYLLQKALGESTAAPFYFPGQIMKIHGREFAVEDGGIVANQPIEVIYNRELHWDRENGISNTYELFAFGTGDVKSSPDTSNLNKGVAGAVETLTSVFASQVNGVIQRMTDEVQKPNSQVTFFGHINTKVDKDCMDDTSPEYVQYMLQKVFDLVRDSSKDKNSALAVMLQRLKLELPAGDKLDSLLDNLKTKIYQISLDTYNSILGKELRLEANPARVELEKTWMKRVCEDCAANGVKASALDFLNRIHPEDNRNFATEQRQNLLNMVQAPANHSWVNDYYAFNNKISNPEADTFFADTNWFREAQDWENQLIAVALLQEFNGLYNAKTDQQSVSSYLHERLKSADTALMRANTLERKQILENLTLLGEAIKKEGRAFCLDNEQAQGWGEWSLSCLNSAVSKPLTTLGTGGTYLIGAATPAGMLLGAATVAVNRNEIVSAVQSHWTGDKPAPEGTPSYELHVGYQAYLDFLKAKYALDHAQ
jgi:predicted patatin/cPLA2 family phospholipase